MSPAMRVSYRFSCCLVVVLLIVLFLSRFLLPTIPWELQLFMEQTCCLKCCAFYRELKYSNEITRTLLLNFLTDKIGLLLKYKFCKTKQ